MRLPRSPRVLVALGLGLALASACSPTPKPPEPIVFWQPWPPEVVGPVVRRFEAEHPGLLVRLVTVPRIDGQNPVDSALAAGIVPDLCVIASDDMPKLLALGALSDWSAGVADQRDSLRGWELCTVGDAVYGMPWMLATQALFWNKSLFARAHLDTTHGPETWDDVRRAAAAIQRLGHGVHGYGVSANQRGRLFERFMPYAWGNEGEVLSAGRDSSRFDSPANRAALEFYLSLRRGGLIGVPGTLDQEFVEGRLGMELAGGWLIPRLRGAAQGPRFGVALVPRPAADRGTHASVAGGEVLVSFQGSRHKPEALLLARFLVRTENALALARTTPSLQPAVRGADSLAYYLERPAEQALVRQLATARFIPSHRQWAAMQAAIEDEIEQALFDKKSAAQAVADADARIVELVGKQ